MKAYPKSSEPFPCPNRIIEERRANPLPLQVAFLMDHPSPHMVALLDALAKRNDCTVEVIYCDRKARGREWGEPAGRLAHRFIPGVTLPGNLRVNPSIFQVLSRKRADIWIVNTCYTSPTTLAAIWWLNRKGIPWAFMNEPPRPRNGLLSLCKSPLLSYALPRAWGIIGTGVKAAEMYKKAIPCGRPTDTVPYYIDLEPFYDLPLPNPPGPHGTVRFVTSSQMIRRKGLDVLLRACELLPRDSWNLALAGEGPLRGQLEKEFTRRWNGDQVRFLGQIQYENRASVFFGNHVFVFPSRWDGWGMVLPEALAAGLPVISTDQVISAHEFIHEGENGFIIPAKNPQAIAEKMTFFIENPASIQPMGFAARQSVSNYRAEFGAHRLVKFLSELYEQKARNDKKSTSVPDTEHITWRRLADFKEHQKRWASKARQNAKNFIINLNLATRPRSQTNGNRILAYHLVLHEDRQRFEEHLKFLTDYFDICSVNEIIQVLSEDSKNDKSHVAITFDDGFRVLMGDCLEILQKYKVSASFYVPTDFVQLSPHPELAVRFSLKTHHYNLPLEPMRPEDLKSLVDLGHEVGSHGISHISLSSLSQNAAERELELSRQQIFEWTGKQPTGFAYPYGHLSSSLGNSSKWVEDAGYVYAVTLRRGVLNKSSPRFSLPRDHVEGNWSVRDLRFFLLS